MEKSFKLSIPIRVFRSSKLEARSAYAPPYENGKVVYRYDGLYIVKSIANTTTRELVSKVGTKLTVCSSNPVLFNFHLTRHESECTMNNITLEQLIVAPTKKKRKRAKQGAITHQKQKHAKLTTKELKEIWSQQEKGKRKGDWTPSGRANGTYKPPSWASSMNVPFNPKNVSWTLDTKKTLPGLIQDGLRQSDQPSELLTDKPKFLGNISCVAFFPPTKDVLINAWVQINNLIGDDDCEDLLAALLHKELTDYNTGNTKVILLAESGVQTPDCVVKAGGPQLSSDVLPEYPGPRGQLFHVYSLGYGEAECLEPVCKESKSSKGTPQFWKLLGVCARGYEYLASGRLSREILREGSTCKLCEGKNENESKTCRQCSINRIKHKLQLLTDCKRKGILLVDSLCTGWSKQQPTEYTLSRKSKEVQQKTKQRPNPRLKPSALVLCWELYTKHVVRAEAEKGHLQAIIPIGCDVANSITKERLEVAIESKNSPNAVVGPIFPAPNAWIPGDYDTEGVWRPGGYDRFYKKMADLVAKYTNS